VTVEVNQPAPRRSRLLYGGLIASLALNLLFVGLFATAAWEHQYEHPKTSEPGLLGFVKELAPDRQGVVRDEITAARESMKELRATVRKSWLDTNALLTAEPFDKAKFKASLAELADIEVKYKAALNNAMAETAEKLAPDERKLLKSWREKRRPGLLAPNKGERSKDDGKSD
jgi:uncharacterized membrane protein